MKYLLIAGLLIVSVTGIAQTSVDTTRIICPVEIMPQFPGGSKGMHQFIDRHLKRPRDRTDVEGKVFVQFTVESDGSITNVKTLKGIHPLFDAEAERVVKLFPKWIPGEMTGVKVPTRMVVSIAFNNRKKEK